MIPVRVMEQARRIRLLILDVDGVLTDGKLFFDYQGNEYKSFHARDGHGMKMLKQTGVEIAVISGRESPIVAMRMQSLGITHVYQNQEDKRVVFNELLVKLELSSDGSFASINHTGDGEVEIITRQGEVYPLEHFGDIVGTIQANYDIDRQYHGELLIVRGGEILERSVGNGILNSVRSGGELPSDCGIVYHVWDYVQLSTLVPKGKYNVKYTDRYNRLVEMVKNDCVSLVDTRIIYTVEEAVAHLEEIVSLGLEGTVLKDGDGIWEDKTSKNCIKLKIVADGIDLEIIGYTEGKGKNKELFGSVMCQSSDGLLRVNISGFTDDMRLYIHNNRERLMGTIMTVKANSITVPTKNNEYYSLFLPRFEELREGDKDVADDLGRIQEIFKSALLDVKQQLIDAMK